MMINNFWVENLAANLEFFMVGLIPHIPNISGGRRLDATGLGLQYCSEWVDLGGGCPIFT